VIVPAIWPSDVWALRVAVAPPMRDQRTMCFRKRGIPLPPRFAGEAPAVYLRVVKGSGVENLKRSCRDDNER
jgi:hypothetical protein